MSVFAGGRCAKQTVAAGMSSSSGSLARSVEAPTKPPCRRPFIAFSSLLGARRVDIRVLPSQAKIAA